MALHSLEREVLNAPVDRTLIGGPHCMERLAGVATSFEALLELEGRGVSASLRIGACWRGSIDVEDIMQVTYIDALLAHRHGCLMLRSIRPWLRVAAEHNLRDAIAWLEARRRPPVRSRVPPASESEARSAPGGLVSRSCPGPAETLERLELLWIVREEIGRLPDIHRQVLDLVCLRGIPRAAAARVLGRSRGAVALLEKRAVSLLRRRIASRVPSSLKVASTVGRLS